MGTDDGLPIEGPAHQVTIEPIFLDVHEVTNRAFARFVEDSGYVTEAERIGWAMVFDVAGGRWEPTDGAFWRAPEGLGSSLDERWNHPVVQVSLADAEAFARWAGKRLPSEAEWERAARGGLIDALYPWGNEWNPNVVHRANTWQGSFPDRPQPEDGFVTTAPVGSFPANPYGIHDMAGNVWEWTADSFDHYQAGDDASASSRSERVIRGGSWLCSSDYCTGYRVAARQGTEPDSALSHLGFRLAQDLPGT